jgi:hypothetical protein
VTEAECLASEDPRAMLDEFGPDHPRDGWKISDRKLRLFACACCRATWHRLSERCRAGVAVAEAHADGLTAPSERGKAFNLADDDPSPTQGRLAMACLRADASEGAREIIPLIEEWVPLPTQAYILRDIVGDPFSPVKLPAWEAHLSGCRQCLRAIRGRFAGQSPAAMRGRCCAAGAPLYEAFYTFGSWRTADVPALAAAAYEERQPDGTLDPARLAVLSDALEEAGCDSEEMLRHLRGYQRCRICVAAGPHDETKCRCEPYFGGVCDRGWVEDAGPHYRGCWALDLVLGRQRT